MKHILSAIIAMTIILQPLIIFVSSSSSIVASGSCGENVKWVLTNDGTMTVSGNGAINDYSYYYSRPSWYPHDNKVTKLIVANGITYIGANAFRGLNKLVEARIAGSVENMREQTFYECISLKTVVLENGAKIVGDSMFDRCTALESVTLPETITTIERDGFRECSSLKSINIPDSVKAIEQRAFRDCTSLATITGMNGVEYIEKEAFAKTLFWNDRVNHEGERYIGKVFFSYRGVMPANTHITIRDGTTQIFYAAFGNQENLTSVTFPNSLRNISESAFYGTGLTEIIIPDSVTELGEAVFAECTSLKWVTLGKGLTEIPRFTFQHTAITELTVPEGINKISALAFQLLPDFKTLTVSPYNPYFTCIDNVLYNKNVTELILGLDIVTDLIIPPTVTKIESCAFYGNENLSTVEMPNSVTTIVSQAFSFCTNLKFIDLPDSLTNIQYGAFWGSGLKKVIIPDSVTDLGRNVFAHCQDLEEIYFGNGITEIPDSACTGNVSLKIIELPKNLKSISVWAFHYCIALREITIPETVVSIKSSAFSACSEDLTLNILNPNLEKLEDGSYAALDNLSVEGIQFYSNVQGVLDLVNAERAKVGVTALTLDKELTEAAMTRAVELSVNFSHTRPSGENFSSIVSKTGITLGENIAAGQHNPEQVIESWMNSAGHRANILSTNGNNAKSIGIGCFQSGNTLYWVQLFSSDNGNTFSLHQDVNDNIKVKFNSYMYDMVLTMYAPKNSNLEPIVEHPIEIGVQHKLAVYVKNPSFTGRFAVFRNESFVFSSSNPNIATVDKTGTVIGISQGTVVITAITPTGNQILFNLHVSDKSNPITTTPSTTTAPPTTTKNPTATTPTSTTKSYILGDIDGKDGVTIFDFMEILKYLIGMDDNLAKNNPVAIISPEGKSKGEPTIFCGIEILKYLVGIDGLVTGVPYNPAVTETIT
ncbi:MAG: leucine-rich repeat protein [Oscillospiraceae bacterium]|nr:leucine-rich repeat protein [Oscillospiraceae bacterium]